MSENTIKRSRTARITAPQKTYLLRYMGNHPEFAKGVFRGPLGHKLNESEWDSLINSLHSIGPQKSLGQWKIIWKEMKQKVKKKFAAYKKSINATGNATAYIEMTEDEMKIISIMGTETSLGLDGIPEAGVEESFNVVVFEQEVDEPNSEIQIESSAPAVAIDIVSETVQEPTESIHINPSIQRTEQIPQQQRTEPIPQQTRPKKMTAEKLLAKSLQQSTESVAGMADNLARIANAMEGRLQVERDRNEILLQRNAIFSRIANVLEQLAGAASGIGVNINTSSV